MEYYAVSLQEILEHREKRAKRTTELLCDYKTTIVCMTMNFAGEFKLLPYSRLIFNLFFDKVLRSIPVSFHEVEYSVCGDYAHFVSNADYKTVKSLMCEIEESYEVGRLFDIDVYYGLNNGIPVKISRETQRLCLVCDNIAFECARSRAHNVGSIRNKSIHLMQKYICEFISECAYTALINEVETTPKPGLVDKNNSGAHTDMDMNTFYASSLAIKPYFAHMALATFKHFSTNNSLDILMEELQDIGRTAEKAMLKATNGINTQLGAIFTIGLLACGAVFTLENNSGFNSITDYAQDLVLSVKKDNKKSYGARFEAESGFRNIISTLNRIEELNKANSFNNASIIALLEVMQNVEDTNVLRRGGQEGLEFMKNYSAYVLSKKNMSEILATAIEFDNEMIKLNLSPGGCADILAAAIFLFILKTSLFFYYLFVKLAFYE